MTDDMWVSKKMNSLAPAAGWRPDEEAALRSLRERKRARRVRRIRVMWGTFAAGLAVAALIGVTAPRACAQPNGCHATTAVHGGKGVAAPVTAGAESASAAPVASSASDAHATVAAKPDEHPAEPQAPMTIAISPTGGTPPGQQFKQSGPANAPVVIEIYSDYECPSCAAFYQSKMPALRAYYGDRLRVVHRDFPLPMHQYAKLAARYANAAGMAGFYDKAVEELFQTQGAWAITGDVDARLAAVLPPDAMEKVRSLVKDAAAMDAMLAPDVALGYSDAIRMTPTMIVVAGGARHIIAPIGEVAEVEAQIDGLTGQKQ